MQYRFVNAHINNGANTSALCKNLVNIGPVTLEYKKGVCWIFATTGSQMIIDHLACWHSETDWNVAILISAG